MGKICRRRSHQNGRLELVKEVKRASQTRVLMCKRIQLRIWAKRNSCRSIRPHILSRASSIYCARLTQNPKPYQRKLEVSQAGQSGRGEGTRAEFVSAPGLEWWRRRELNPRPKMLLVKRLHAYSRSCPGHYPRTFAAVAQNGQETPAASLRS